MDGLFVLTAQKSKEMVAEALAKKIHSLSNRIFITYGSTNEYLLRSLGYNIENYYRGYVGGNALRSNMPEHKPVIINDHDGELTANDIIIKGANALAYKEDGGYDAAVAVASPSGGTYRDLIVQGMCVGAEILVPITHEKLVPRIYSGIYSQSSFDIVMGRSISLFKLDSGKIFTEIEAFKELFELDAKLYIAGGIEDCVGSHTFIASGSEENLSQAYEYLNRGT